MSLPKSTLLLLVASLAGCAYPDYASGVAPSYPSGYQPVMGGYATDWPAQPGALWGPENVPGIEVFREPLTPYGRWLQSPQWGVVFVPNAPTGWRPYQNGQWLENRFWLSADPWGWATDHYGRWGFDQAVGWVWVPDVTWGPSWVAWREADDVVGWAPIPPRVAWSVGFGFGNGWGYDNWNSWYGPSWVWVPRSNLYARGFGGRIYPWNSGLNWWGRSRWQHAPYWGWNQPWDRSWGWRAPGWNRGWNRGGQYWNNNRGWNDGRWNNRGNWDGNWGGNRGRGWDQPRRGEPGSVGDRIGRDLAGEPPRPNGNWNGNGNGGLGNGGWNRGARGDGQPGNWSGGNRPSRRADAGDSNGGMNGGMNRGGGSWQGRQPQAQPQPQPQQQPQPQPRFDGGRPDRGNDGGGWRGGNQGRNDGGQPSRGVGPRSDRNERPQ